jgi:DNA-binding MarR family transcriptional regulator
MTWKQFDILLLLRDNPGNTTALLSDDIEEIQRYDMGHGGAFYGGTSWSSVYSTLRTLERRRLVDRHIGRNGLNQWMITERGRSALEFLE